jgi:hypothetical protein
MAEKMKIPALVLLGVLLFVSVGAAQDSKVRVVVERARIYAEASADSYRIETVKKGTILTLFGSKQAGEDWLYVNYQSPRWGSRVTGFIQAEMVEEFEEGEEIGAGQDKKPLGRTEEKKQAEKPAEQPAEKPVEKAKLEEKKELEEQETKVEEKRVIQETVKEAAEVPERREIPETKEEPVSTERAVGKTELPLHKVWELPLSSLQEQSPRFYQVVTEKEGEAGIVPEGARTAVLPKDEVKTEAWERKVVVPAKTEITEKEREIPEEAVEEETQPPAMEKEAQIVTPKPPEIPRAGAAEGNPLFTLSLGYGPSLGGFGGFVQLNASGSLAVHWGFGYYPTSLFYPDYDWVRGKPLSSVGVNYYLPWRSSQVRPYVDFQYGGISVEAVRVVTGIWYYTYVYEDIQKTLWGPSLMAGIELRFGNFGLNGAVGGSYVITDWEYWDQPLFVTADIGILLYF